MVQPVACCIIFLGSRRLGKPTEQADHELCVSRWYIDSSPDGWPNFRLPRGLLLICQIHPSRLKIAATLPGETVSASFNILALYAALNLRRTAFSTTSTSGSDGEFEPFPLRDSLG